jgi:hypothetical protein
MRIFPNTILYLLSLFFLCWKSKEKSVFWIFYASFVVHLKIITFSRTVLVYIYIFLVQLACSLNLNKNWMFSWYFEMYVENVNQYNIEIEAISMWNIRNLLRNCFVFHSQCSQFLSSLQCVNLTIYLKITYISTQQLNLNLHPHITHK